MNIFDRLAQFVSDPVLALFTSMTLIIGGHYLKKPPVAGDMLGGLFPIVEKFGSISMIIGFIVLVLFFINTVARSR